jgi:hypothetical protein
MKSTQAGLVLISILIIKRSKRSGKGKKLDSSEFRSKLLSLTMRFDKLV